MIAALMLVWFASLFVLRIIPRYHWEPIRHITKSALRRGSALKFDTKAGLRALKARRPKGAADRGHRPHPARGAGSAEERGRPGRGG